MNDLSADLRERPGSGIIVRELQETDIAQLIPVIETWVRDSKGEVIRDEVDGIVARMKASLLESGADDQCHYLVACEPQRGAVGMIGYRKPQGAIAGFAKTDRPAEGVNLFVEDDVRKLGVGSKLNQALITELISQGFQEFLFDSGPRYEKTGHSFHDAHYQRVGIIPDRYGPGVDAPVWRAELTPPEPHLPAT